MKYIETFEVILQDGELLFKDKSSGKVFDLILPLHFRPEATQKDDRHYVQFVVMRKGKKFDSGEKMDVTPYGPSFVADKIFQDQKHDIGLMPEMFLEGDVIHLYHNSRSKFAENLRKYNPPFYEFSQRHNKLPRIEQARKYKEMATEIFPSVYRFKSVSRQA